MLPKKQRAKQTTDVKPIARLSWLARNSWTFSLEIWAGALWTIWWTCLWPLSEWQISNNTRCAYLGICYPEMQACLWTGWHRFDGWGTQFTWFALCGWHSDFWPVHVPHLGQLIAKPWVLTNEAAAWWRAEARNLAKVSGWLACWQVQGNCNMSIWNISCNIHGNASVCEFVWQSSFMEWAESDFWSNNPNHGLTSIAEIGTLSPLPLCLHGLDTRGQLWHGSENFSRFVGTRTSDGRELLCLCMMWCGTNSWIRFDPKPWLK